MAKGLKGTRREGSKAKRAWCASGEFGPVVWLGGHPPGGGERRLPGGDGLWNVIIQQERHPYLSTYFVPGVAAAALA